MDISEPAVITPELEVVFYEKYNAPLAEGNLVSRWIAEDYYELLSTSDFVRDVLANRYFLQKDYAKSFLLTNSISELERNPRLDLLDELEAFYRKPGKNSMEKLIAGNFSLTDCKGTLF